MVHTFACTDSAGESHAYDVTRHRGSEGMPIALQLSALVVEPLAAAVGPLLAEAVAAGNVKSVLDANIAQSIDADKIGSAVKSTLAGLPPSLVFSILRYTNRGGKALVVAETGKPTPAFDDAFAGNYLELARALWEVSSHNGFFPGLGSLSAVAERVRAARPATPASAA